MSAPYPQYDPERDPWLSSETCAECSRKIEFVDGESDVPVWQDKNGYWHHEKCLKPCSYCVSHAASVPCPHEADRLLDEAFAESYRRMRSDPIGESEYCRRRTAWNMAGRPSTVEQFIRE